ncbi:hypothetical protein EV363DRAFT_1335494 [Boletus edulis]|uniref:DUF6534 domain-containing protein n=1 Tax=Boletus edulis BED1 TaxID=1328754 RepID=A0AAD4GD75_BOLED|nr:hypothetical protein EV363DRAFT_1335494 [Boletus edulis]KAF8438504.1 hypothetical protein L210DRAFT_3544171 [Boletus edulis BED1]
MTTSLDSPMTTLDFDAAYNGTYMQVNGPFVIGYTLSFALMGALVVQAYIYFTRFTDDRRAIKALVMVVLLLETLITALVFYGLWATSTSEFSISIFYYLGQYLMGPLLGMVLASMAGLVTTLTHGFYCWRISTLRKSLLIPFPIMMVSLLQLASIIILAFRDGLFPASETINNSANDGTPPAPPVISISYKLAPWLVTWLGGSVVCDVAITTCMTLSLRPSNSHFSSNRSTLVKLTRLTIETGLVTSVAALVELILGVVFEMYFYHIAVFFAISKLYANCLLASLNFRLVLRSQSDPNLTAIVWDNIASDVPRYPGAQPSHVTHIVAQVETDVDELDVVIDMGELGPGKNSSIADQASNLESMHLLDRSMQA